MPPIDHITTFASDQPVLTIIIGVFALVLLVVAYFALRAVQRMAVRFFHSHVAPRPVEDILTIVAASIATGVSAQGMWRFSGDVLGFDGPLRLLLFAFIEVAVITSAVRARRNMRENFSAGIDGIAVWALTGLTAVLSSMDARSIPETVFRLASPLVAAWLWERGMAIERHRVTGRKRIHWRLTPERVLVRLGLAESRDRTAGEVDRQRRFTKVTLAADRARALRDSEASSRRQRRALARFHHAYAAAHAHTGLGCDEALQQTLAAEVASLRSASDLLDVAPASAWTQPAEEAPSPFERLADETQRLNESLAVRDELRAIEANVSMLAADVTSAMTRSGVINPVNSGINDSLMIVPPEWTGEAPAMTPDVTPDVTPGRVIDLVNFDINNPAIFDLEWPPPALADMTPQLTPDMTPPDVNPEVTEQSKADVMRAFWEKERAEGRYPRTVDLAREADADTAQASRLRAELIEALPWREQRKAKAIAKKAVNGSKPS